MVTERTISLSLLVVTFMFNNLPMKYFAGTILVVYIAYVYGDFIYRSYLTLNRDLRWVIFYVTGALA